MPGGRDTDEDALLDRATGGDQDAFDELLQRHRPRLRHMVAVRIDPRLKGRIDPSDVVQDVLLEAARMLPDYLRRRPLPYYPWLRQLAWQRLYDLHVRHIRTQGRSITREARLEMELSDESIMHLAQHLVASGTTPSWNLVRDELRRRVRQALTRLKETDREVLFLRYLEQLSAKEIAAIVGSTEAAVNMRHLRALKRLHVLLVAEE
jgi:RNA polymerase sigma-70 factor (ECF subfamily)